MGQSEENIRLLFADAEAEYRERGDESDLHIIIFDEIDSICKARAAPVLHTLHPPYARRAQPLPCIPCTLHLQGAQPAPRPGPECPAPIPCPCILHLYPAPVPAPTHPF